MEEKHQKLHQKNKDKNEKKKSHKKHSEKKSEDSGLVQKKTVVSEKVEESYGSPNAKPSKYEKKLRKIFTELKSCSQVALKNLDKEGQVLTQTKDEITIANTEKELVDDQLFKMVKHPDQKKYMHYALQNA